MAVMGEPEDRNAANAAPEPLAKRPKTCIEEVYQRFYTTDVGGVQGEDMVSPPFLLPFAFWNL